MSSRKWTNRFLDGMRQRADPPADDLVARTYAIGGQQAVELLRDYLRARLEPSLEDGVLEDGVLEDDVRTPRSRRKYSGFSFVEPMLKRLREDPEALPGVLEFLEAPVPRPDFLDLEKVKRMDGIKYDAKIAAVLLLFVKSWPQYFSNVQAARVFFEAHALSGRDLDEFKRFLLGITRLSIDLLFEQGLVKPWLDGSDSYGHVFLKTLRLQHAVIRHNLCRAGWNKKERGWPVNQEDLAAAMLAFALWSVDGLKKLGIRLTNDEEEAVLETWKATVYLLGLDVRMQPANVKEGRSLLKKIGSRQFRYSAEGRAMTVQLLGSMTGMLAYGIPKAVAEFNSRLKLKLPDPFPFVHLLSIFLPLAHLLYFSDSKYVYLLRMPFSFIKGYMDRLGFILRLVWPDWNVKLGRLMTEVHKDLRLLEEWVRNTLLVAIAHNIPGLDGLDFLPEGFVYDVEFDAKKLKERRMERSRGQKGRPTLAVVEPSEVHREGMEAVNTIVAHLDSTMD